MAMILRSSRLRLTQAIYFGEPPSGGSGTVTQINAGSGITLTPNPIIGVGSVAVTAGTFVRADGTVPLTANWNAGNFNINSRNSMPVFNVEAYGAVASGAGDQSAAIQAAITAASVAGGGIVQFGAGTYRITSTLIVTFSKVILRGAGQFTTSIFYARAIGNAVEFNGGAGISGNGIEDIQLVCFDDINADGFGVNARVSGRGFSLTTVGNYVITNVAVTGGWNGLYLNACNSGFIQNVIINSILFANQSNDGVTLFGNCIANVFIDVIVNSTNIGFRLDGNIDTADFYRCGAQKLPGADIKYGFKVENTGGGSKPQWIRMFDCSSETSDTNGVCFYLNGCQGVELHGCQTSWGLNALYMNQVTTHDILVHGGLFMLSGELGIVGAGAKDVLIHGLTVSNCGWKVPHIYDGIYVSDGSKNWRIINCRVGHSVFGATPPAPAPAGKSQQYGINLVTGGNSTDVIIEGNDLTDNVLGPIIYGAVLASSVSVLNNAEVPSGLAKELGVNVLSPTRALDINGAQRLRGMVAPTVSEANSGVMYFDSGLNKYRVSMNGSAYVDLVGSGGVTGSGVAGKLTYWTAATNLTDEPNITLGGASTLDVNGNINIQVGGVLLMDGLNALRIGFGGAPVVVGTSGAVGADTTAIGVHAADLETGGKNTAVGTEAGQAIAAGALNSAVGYRAIVATTTGNENTALGYRAGDSNTTGSNNLFLGSDADAAAGNLTNAVAIGYQASVAASDSMVLGNGSMNVGIRTSTPVLPLDVNGAIGTRHHDETFVNGANQDFPLTMTSFVRAIGPGAPFNIGGFANGVDGRVLFIRNTVAFQMTLNNLDAGSVGANQIVTPTGGAINCSVATMIYDDTSDKWVVMSYF